MSKFHKSLQYYLLVAVVGLTAAFIAIAFYTLYLGVWNFTKGTIDYSTLSILPLSFLAIGVPYVLVKRFATTKTTGSGTHAVLEAYHLTNGEVSLRDTVVKPTAAMLTLGLGGSAGPEGPSLLAGGGVGSAFSKYFRIKPELRRKLFIAGAAAGLSATFRTPLAAILFALEIPYKNDIDRETFIEASIASIPAYLLSITLLGSEPFFGEIIYTLSPTLLEIGLSLLLGIICGVYAVFFTKTFLWTKNVAVKVKRKIGNTGLAISAAIILSVCGTLSFYSIGVGLHFIHAIIVEGTSFSITATVMIVLFKTLATSVTLNFGGSGGLFVPTMVVGAAIGYIFSVLFDANLAVTFIAVGMAALISGTHKVLLMPVAFIVESLGGAFAIPALLASGVSYVISGKHSFHSTQPRTKLKTEELALERFFLKGKKLIPEKLEQTKAVNVMTKEPVVLSQGITVKEATEIFEKTNLRVLPVVDDQARVVGVIHLEDLGYVDLRRQEMNLSETAMHNPTVINEEKSIDEVAQLMIDTQQDHVFVVNKQEKLVGVISGIDIVKKILELLST